MTEVGEADVPDGCAAVVALAPFLAVAHFAAGSWLSFVLFGLAGGIETDGRLTRYGGIEYAWTNLAWLPGGLLIAVGDSWATFGAFVLLAGSGVAGISAATVFVGAVSRNRPRFGRGAWRVWVVVALWLVWVPVPAVGTVTYWHTVAY
jgi:hypothetical protein